MCGIAGIVDVAGGSVDQNVLQRMGELIAHRGPDDCGTYVAPGVGLAHRRLSIIDLSAGGHQPMTNEDGSLWVVFNGEIYNFKELVTELSALGHRFHSHTDTEVILHAYEQWGSAFLDRLNGMFAFAIWDAQRSRLFAARDRIGIKPFYYWCDGRTLVFASEIKALFCHPKVSAKPNLPTVREYLLFGNTTGSASWYEGVCALLPGHALTFDSGGQTLAQYWDVAFEIDYDTTFAAFAEELRALLANAVSIHLRSDVPVGAHLSGGVDSSTIVALAARELGSLHTFSAAYAEGAAYDERRYIDIVSRTYATHHHVVVPTAAELPDLLPRLVWHLDEPVIGAAILPMYRVNQMVRASGIKVVNGGQGADEAFGGYPPYFVRAARNLVNGWRCARRGPFSELLRVPQYLSKGGGFSRWFSRRTQENCPNWVRDVRSHRSAGLDFMADMRRRHPQLQAFELGSYIDLKYYLPGLLQLEDRMSMAWSIESRVPLLDHRIIELAARMPSWMKVRGGWSKAVLRHAVRGITPDAILDRRDKKGYPVPTQRWFRSELAPYIRQTLVDRPLASDAVIDRRELARMVHENISGARDHSGAIWRALNAELWFRGLEHLPHAHDVGECA